MFGVSDSTDCSIHVLKLWRRLKAPLTMRHFPCVQIVDERPVCSPRIECVFLARGVRSASCFDQTAGWALEPSTTRLPDPHAEAGNLITRGIAASRAERRTAAKWTSGARAWRVGG